MLTVLLMTTLLKLFTINIFEFIPNKMATNWKLKSSISSNYSDKLPKNIIIGSSRTLALHPTKIKSLAKKEFINLSVPSAEISYVYYTLKRIIDKNIKINSVYIEIPASNNMSSGFNDHFIRNFVSKDELQEYSKYNEHSLDRYHNTRKYSKDYVNKDLNFFVKGLIKYTILDHSNDLYNNKLLKNGGYTLIGDPKRKASTKEALSYRRIVEKVTASSVPTAKKVYLKKILNLLSKHDISYKFFFSPYPKASKQIKNLGLGNYVKLLYTIPNNNINTNVLILNDDLFIDGSHANLKGSEMFNKYFVQNILGIDLKKKFSTYEISLSN